MNVLLLASAGLLFAIAVASAIGKFRRAPQVVGMLGRLGLSDRQILLLGGVDLLGALGLLLGIWVPLFGILAAGGFLLYFAGALIAHLRARDTPRQMAPALVVALVSLAALVAELGR